MLLRSSIIISFFTLISRIFGYLREIMMAIALGAGPQANAFHVAFRFANVFRSFLAEGAFTSSFVPIYSKKIKQEPENANKYAGQVLSLLIITVMSLTIIVEIFMPSLMSILAPGFKDDEILLANTILLSRICFPYLIFMCIGSFYGGILSSFSHYLAIAISPLILNLFMICSLLKNNEDKLQIALMLSTSIVLSGIFQLMLVVINTLKIKVIIKPAAPNFRDPNLRKFLYSFFPGVLSASVIQINLWVSTSIATYYDSLVSYIYYADRVIQLPLALIGTSIGIVLLPSLSKLTASNDTEKINSILNRTIEITMIMIIPTVFLCILMAEPITKMIFEYGAFTDKNSYKTSMVMMILSMALPAFILNKIFTPRFFSIHDTRTPFIAAFTALTCNVLINITLLKLYPSYLGVPIATTISSWINIIILYIISRYKGLYIMDRRMKKVVSISLALSLFCTSIIFFLKKFTLHQYHFIDTLAKLSIFMVLYLVLSYYTKILKLKELRSSLTRRDN